MLLDRENSCAHTIRVKTRVLNFIQKLDDPVVVAHYNFSK